MAMNSAGKGALIGGGIGLAVGGFVDAGIAMMDATATVVVDTVCDNPPCRRKDNVSTSTYVIVPLAIGAFGAGLGAIIGGAMGRNDVSVAPSVFMDDDVPVGGGLSFCKSF